MAFEYASNPCILPNEKPAAEKRWLALAAVQALMRDESAKVE